MKYRITPGILGDTDAVILGPKAAPLVIIAGAYVIVVSSFVMINVRVIDTVGVVKLLGVLAVKTAVMVWEPLLSFVLENTSVLFTK